MEQNTERRKNNFADGGNVAGLVLWAPVAARRDEVRAACGTNASAENSPRCSVQDVGDSPKGRSAALSGELGGARNVPRNRAGKCRATEKLALSPPLSPTSLQPNQDPQNANEAPFYHELNSRFSK